MIQFQLKIPAELTALRIVQSFVAETANICGFRDDILKQFYLIAEEAFLYVLRLLKDEEKDIKITVESKTDNKYFIISFFDKGIPFSYEKDYSDIEKIGLKLIKAYCRKLMWINHGKSGKELRILFIKPQKDITQYKLISSKKIELPSDDIAIEILNPKNAYQISQLIYRTYGYTYPNEDMYYPERIEKLNLDGKIVSVVAVDKRYNKIVGHYAVERYDMGNIAELGQAAIEPDYRGKNLLFEIRKNLEETARNLNIKGIYSQPVTSHTKTQRINEKFNAKACGISFGLVPKEFDFKKMEVKPLSERESCFMYFKPFVFKTRSVYLPKKHKGMIEAIYKNIGIKLETPKRSIFFERSILDAKYNAPWGFGVINALKMGGDFETSLKNVFQQLKLSTQADVLFLNIPLGDYPVDEHIETAQKLGFFFCGVLPYALNGKDIVRFQYLNTMIDVNRIKVYGDFARKIFDYSTDMMRKVLT